jgi:sugar lactone lactonase YvrE
MKVRTGKLWWSGKKFRDFQKPTDLEAIMMSTFALAFCLSMFRRIASSLLLSALTCTLLLVAAPAQVTFTGAKPNVNIGSQKIGSTSATVSLPFSITANTKVGSIAVLTTGSTGRDFVQAMGSTCTAKTFTMATSCTVNVAFRPSVAGLRLGAVTFFSAADNRGTALAEVPVFGIGTGPQLVFGPGGTQTKVGGRFVSPEAVAIDSASNAYIGDIALQEVFKVTPAGKQTAIGSGLEVPGGVAVDGAGNIYITDSQAAVVYKVSPSGAQNKVGSGFSFPSGVAVDGAGNVYVSDPFIPTVFKITPGGKQSMVGSGYNTPAGVAVDSAGNVYVADTYSAAVFKITPAGKQTKIAASLNTPAAVAVDTAGSLYITDDGTDSLYEVTSDGTQTTISDTLDVPNGVALDGLGNLYVANTFDEQILKIDRAHSPSLTFDPTKINSKSADSPKTVRVENIGNAALSFSALSYPPDFPEGALDDDCTASTSLSAADTCSLTIEFSPVTPLGSKPSAVLSETVRLTTNSLNVAHKVEQVNVSGKELP